DAAPRWPAGRRRGPGLFQEGLRLAGLNERLEPTHDLAPGVVHRADLLGRISREVAHAEFDLGLVVRGRLESPGDGRVLPPGELAETSPRDAFVLLERVDPHSERHRRSLELKGRDVTDLRRHRVIRNPEAGLAFSRCDRPVDGLRLRSDLYLVDHVAQHQRPPPSVREMVRTRLPVCKLLRGRGRPQARRGDPVSTGLPVTTGSLV